MSWKSSGERSSMLLIRLMGELTRRVPRRHLHWLLYPITAYFYLTGGRARRASHAYLARVHGRPARRAEVFAHMLAFSRVTLDRAYLLQDAFESFELTVIDEHIAKQARLRANGAMLAAGAHFGSFEAMRASGRMMDVDRIFMVMYEDNAQKISSVLASLNPRVKAQVIALGQPDSMLKVRDALEQGGLACILADRLFHEDQAREDSAMVIPFLGAPARFPTGPFRMAALLRRPMVLMMGILESDHRYRIVFEELHDFSTIADAQARRAAIPVAMRRYVERLEHYCRTYPDNWFNFFDFWAMPAGAAARPSADSNASMQGGAHG